MSRLEVLAWLCVAVMLAVAVTFYYDVHIRTEITKPKPVHIVAPCGEVSDDDK